jgi:hypothetical protein
MTKADLRVNTPPLNTSPDNATLSTVGGVDSTRRTFLARAAAVAAGGAAIGAALSLSGSAAGAGLTHNAAVEAIAGAPSQSPVLTLDWSLASDELQSAFRAMGSAHDTLKTAWAEYQKAEGLVRDWEQQHPSPGGNGRAYRKWERRWCKQVADIGYADADSAYMDARADFKRAKVEVALVKVRDLNELALKAAAVYAFEDIREEHLRDITPTIALSVAVALGLMAASQTKGAAA